MIEILRGILYCLLLAKILWDVLAVGYQFGKIAAGEKVSQRPRARLVAAYVLDALFTLLILWICFWTPTPTHFYEV